MTCKQCGKNGGHWCTNCGMDGDLYPLSQGYCSDDCLIAAGKMTWDQLCESEDEVEAVK